MRTIILTLLIAGLSITAALAAPGGDLELMVIYSDAELHDPPADRASAPLTTVEDTTAVVAWAGAVWVGGAEDFTWLNGRGYCLAWEVRPAAEFDDFLQEHGYRRYRPAEE